MTWKVFSYQESFLDLIIICVQVLKGIYFFKKLESFILIVIYAPSLLWNVIGNIAFKIFWSFIKSLKWSFYYYCLNFCTWQWSMHFMHQKGNTEIYMFIFKISISFNLRASLYITSMMTLNSQSLHSPYSEENMILNARFRVLGMSLTNKDNRIILQLFTREHLSKYASLIEFTSFPNHLRLYKLKASTSFKWEEMKKVFTDTLDFSFP